MAECIFCKYSAAHIKERQTKSVHTDKSQAFSLFYGYDLSQEFNMLYIIKLEDKTSGRESQIVCPANMTLEELRLKIQLQLQLPYEGLHWFMMQGKIYVPEKDWIPDMYGGRYDDLFLPMEVTIQHRINYPNDKDIRNSEHYTLRQVFTTIGSVIRYDQDTSGVHYNTYRFRGWPYVLCTLVKKIR